MIVNAPLTARPLEPAEKQSRQNGRWFGEMV
jgi:hypothetical protein